MSIGGVGGHRDRIEPMSDFKSKPGSFLPFLEFANRDKAGRLQEGAGTMARRREPVSPLTLLEILASQSLRSLPLFDLQAQSGLEPEALKSLLNAGYISITGEVPEQLVILTSGGAAVAQLARLA